jgi:hemerythrin-like domain-containing protein
MPQRDRSGREGGKPIPAPPVSAAALNEPLPLTLLDEPLEFIFADHYRNRRIAAALRRFGEDGTVSRAEADMVVSYMSHDLPMHHDDEDMDLFPAVRRKSLATDDLGDVLTRLTEEHHLAKSSVAALIDALSQGEPSEPVRLSAKARNVMLAYAKSEQRHLAIENGIVMVIARRRLSANDIRRISRGMKARRGVPC